MLRPSVIVTTYRSPEFLEMCLATVVAQNFPLSEIIVAEDGEDARNAEVIKKAAPFFKGEIKHIRQKDSGNRKPLIMNKAVLASKGDYLVFVDGDCLLRRDFVAEHLKRASDEAFLCGRRVELSKVATETLNLSKIRAGYLDGWPVKLYWDAITGETHSLGRFFKTPKMLRKILGQEKVLDIRGCNFSLHKKSLEKINGFTNDFSGAYGEDSDAEYRLKYAGFTMKSVKGAALQFHLWHPTQEKDLQNQKRLEEVQKLKEPRAKNGLAEAASIL